MADDSARWVADRPHDAAKTNREAVVQAIADAGPGGITTGEIAEKTGLDRWVVVACVWLASSRLWPAHDEADPWVVKWRIRDA